MKILKDSLWANGSALLTQVIALVTTLIVARFVGPHEYGLVATGLVILLFFQRFLLESFGFAVIRETEKYEGFVESANYCSIIFGYLSSLLMLVIASILYFYSYTELAVVLVALSIIPILDGYGTIRTCILRRDGKFKQLAGRVLIANSVSGFFAILLAIGSLGIWALIIQQIVLALFNLIIAYKYANWIGTEKINSTSIKRILAFGLPMMGNSFAMVAANRIDILILSYFSTAHSVGIYSIAKRIIRTLPDVFINGSNAVVMTHIRNKNNVDALKLIFLQIRYISALIIPILLFIFLQSKLIIKLIFGNTWIEAAEVLSVLCLYAYLQMVYTILSNFLIKNSESKKILSLNFIQLAVFIGSSSLGLWVLDFNVILLSYALIISCFISLFLLIMYLYKKYSMPIFLFISMIYFPLVLSLIVLLEYYLFNDLLNFILLGLINLTSFYILFLIFDKRLKKINIFRKIKGYLL